VMILSASPLLLLFCFSANLHQNSSSSVCIFDPVSTMEGPTHYVPTGASANTSSRVVQFPQISSDNELERRSTKSTPAFTRTLFNCFGLFHSAKPKPKKRVSVSTPKQHGYIDRKSGTSTISTLSLPRMDSSIDASPYKWPHDSSFDSKTTALVIIDMQKDCECKFLTA